MKTWIQKPQALRKLPPSNLQSFGKLSQCFYTYIKFILYFCTKFKSPVVGDWQGFSFELLCLLHLRQIKQALGISGMATEASAWRIADNKKKQQDGAQIDLIITRADRIINLCEMKFSTLPYHLTSKEETALRERAAIFQKATKTTYSLAHTYVTTFGVANPEAHSILQSQVQMDDLFGN